MSQVIFSTDLVLFQIPVQYWQQPLALEKHTDQQGEAMLSKKKLKYLLVLSEKL